MSEVVAATVMVAGTVVLVAAWMRGWWRGGFLAALELWTAGVLVRLAVARSWATIAVVAGVVAVRGVVRWERLGLRPPR